MQNFRALLDRQKAHFNTDATKTYERRIEQPERVERRLKENAVSFEETVRQDFEFTKSQLREWMKPTRRPCLSEAWERRVTKSHTK